MCNLGFFSKLRERIGARDLREREREREREEEEEEEEEEESESVLSLFLQTDVINPLCPDLCSLSEQLHPCSVCGPVCNSISHIQD
jgi:hypothetical protein